MNARARKIETVTGSLDAFKSFISAMGGEVLVPTNEYEVVRFRSRGATSIIYRKDNGNLTFTGDAQEAWGAYLARTPFRMADATPRRHGARMEPIDRAIVARDGDTCFYCAALFDGDNPRTREHLVAATAGGPNHISNLFHACGPCNLKAGHLSAPEKIRLRDQMRGVK